MRKNKVKKVDLENAEITPRGKIFMQWVEMNLDDDRDLSIQEIMDEFNDYYNSLFNPQV